MKQAAYGSLTYNVNINDTKAQSSLRTLKGAIRSTGHEWRSNASAMQAAGDSASALEAKITGLNKEIELQSDYNKRLADALKHANAQTDKEKLAVMRWTNELTRSNAALKRRQSELASARAAEIRFSTGIDKAKTSHKAYTSVIEANEKALLAEGKEEQASAKHKQLLAAKTSALKDELGREEKAFKALKSSASSSNVDINKQSAVVSKTREAYARAREEQRKYSTGLHKMEQYSKSTAEISQSLASRLRAEGKNYTAMSVELKTLVGSRKGLLTQYKTEMSELELIKKRSGDTSAAYSAQAKKVNELGTKISETNSKIRSLGKYVGTSQNVMTSFSDKIGGIQQKYAGVATAMSAVSRGAGYASLGIAVLTKQGVSMSTSLESSFIRTKNLIVKSNTEGTSEINHNLAQMKENAQSYSKEYGLSQQKIADGYQDLIKRGYSSAQALGSMKTLVKGAIATGDDFNDVTAVSTQTLESFGLRANSTAQMAKNTSKVVNEMAYAADMTATDFQSLGKGMEYVGNTAHQAGFSISETASAMGILSNNGLESDKAGTGLRKTINSLVSPTDNATGALKKLGLSTKSFTDKNGKMKSMSDIFGILNSHMKNLSGHDRTDVFHAIFGTTGQQAGGILTDNYKSLGKLNDEVAKSAKNNYIGGLSAKNMETAQNQFKKFKATFQSLEIEFANVLLPYLTKGAKALIGLMDKFDKLSPSAKKAAGATLLLVPAISAVTGAIAAFIRNSGTIANVISKLFRGSRVKTADASRSAVIAIEEQTAAVKALSAAWAEAGRAAGAEASQAEAGVGGSGVGGTDVPAGGTGKSTRTKSTSKVGRSSLSNAVGEIKQVESETQKATKATSRWSRVVGKFKGGFSKAFSGLGFIVKRAGTVVSLAITAWDLGSSVVKVFEKPSFKNKIKLESKATGALIGGGIGFAAGGPLGATLGTQIGAEIGSSKTFQKVIKATHRLFDRVRKDYTAKKGTEYAVLGTVRTSSSASKQQAKASRVSSNGYMTSISEFQKGAKAGGIVDDSNSVIKSVQRNLNKLPDSAFKAGKAVAKKLKSAFSKTNLNFGKLEFAVDNKSLSKAMKDSKAGYKAITDTVVNYAKHNEKQSKKTLQGWVKSGLMSKQDAQTALNNEKRYYDGRLKNAKKSVNSLENVDKQYYKSAKQENSMHNKAMTGINKQYGSTITGLERKRNSAINKLTQGYYVKYKGQYLSGQSGIAKINKIYGDKIKKQEKAKDSAIKGENKRHQDALTADSNAAFKRRLKLLSKAQANTDLIIQNGSSKQKSILRSLSKASGKISKGQADKLVHEAYRTYKGVTKHANKTYKDAKDSATKKYKSTVAAAQKEYYQNHSISKKQMNRIVSNATTQYKDTVKQAKKQRDDTTRHAKTQYTNVTKQASKQMKDHGYYVDKETGHVKSKWSTLGGSLSEIWGGIKSGFNSLLSLFGAKSSGSGSGHGSSHSSSRRARAKSGDMGHRIEANAVGGKVHNGMALVGEAGAELAYEPYSGTARILGENGPEIAKVSRNEIILPADKTRQVLSGSYGKGKTLPGYATGFLGEAEKLAKSTVDIGEAALDKISSMVSAPIKWVEKNILGKIKWPGFDDSWTLKGATAIKDSTINKVKGFAKSLADKLGDFGAVGNVKLGGSVASRARALAKAFKKAYPASNNGGIAGILGNWIQESNLNPSAVNASDHGTGLGQWTFTRETGLRNWLRRHGYAWNSAAGQIGYALNEPGANGMLKSVLRMTNPTAAAQRFFATWESGGNMDASGGARLRNASAVYRYIKGMENGGLVDKAQMINIAEHNKPEMVVSLTNKDAAIRQLKQSISYLENGNVATTVDTQNAKSADSEKLDQIAVAIQQTNALLQAILSSNNTPNVAYVASQSVVDAVEAQRLAKARYNNLIN